MRINKFTATFFLPLLTAYWLTSLLLPRSVLAASIYNRSPWPEAYKGLTFEKDNTDFEDAAHPCFRSAGRSFKLSHKDSFKLIGISVYVYVPNRQEGRFNRDLLRLSFLDSNNKELITKISSTYSAVISRDGNAQPTFEVYFPLNLNVLGGVTYTAILECLTDEDLLRIVESSRVSDGETSYYNANTGQVTPYYLSGRKILFTTFSEWLSAHFPALASTNNQQLITNNNPPKYHPVIFVHGLGGTPGAFDGSEDQNRNYVKLLKDLGYPPDYIYLYSYGYKEDGRGGTYYNYQGDIREIASGMEVTVNTLSEKHKAQGGDGRVDIVAHSLGNLVTRQYLLTHKDNHKIRRYVGIGAPFKGAWVMGVDKGIRSLPIIGKEAESAVANFLLGIHNKGKTNKLSRDSAASVQATPNSDFLEGSGGINRTKINNLEFYAVYGDVNTVLRQKIFSKSFEKKINIGDGLILSDSATYSDWINFPVKKFAYNDGMILDLKFDRGRGALAAELQVDNPNSLKTLHSDLLSRQDSRGKIICLISQGDPSKCYD